MRTRVFLRVCLLFEIKAGNFTFLTGSGRQDLRSVIQRSRSGCWIKQRLHETYLTEIASEKYPRHAPPGSRARSARYVFIEN